MIPGVFLFDTTVQVPNSRVWHYPEKKTKEMILGRGWGKNTRLAAKDPGGISRKVSMNDWPKDWTPINFEIMRSLDLRQHMQSS